ncbi:MAG: DUF664 domain-containing protein [Mycobacteriales bacterium]
MWNRAADTHRTARFPPGDRGTKVAGRTVEQAASTPVSPSNLTPAGVVKHRTGVERFWFSIDFAGANLSVPGGGQARCLCVDAAGHGRRLCR